MLSKLRTTKILISTVKNWWDGLFLRLYLIPEEKLTKLKLRNGFVIFVRPKSGDLNEVITVLSGKEYKVENFLKSKRPVIVDVGGHIGTFALLTKSLNKNAKIYAIEPEPNNYSLLKKNISANNFSAVKIIEQAVSNKSGDTHIKSESGLMNYASVDIKNGHKVKTTTLDKLIDKNSITEIDILKIDCEGSELKVLQGFSNRNICKNIFVETHEFIEKGITANVIELLESSGFKIENKKIKEDFGTQVLHFTQ